MENLPRQSSFTFDRTRGCDFSGGREERRQNCRTSVTDASTWRAEAGCLTFGEGSVGIRIGKEHGGSRLPRPPPRRKGWEEAGTCFAHGALSQHHQPESPRGGQADGSAQRPRETHGQAGARRLAGRVRGCRCSLPPGTPSTARAPELKPLGTGASTAV